MSGVTEGTEEGNRRRVPALRKLTICKKMTTILTFVQHFIVFKALSLSHLIFLTILPSNFDYFCFSVRKPKLSESHGAAPKIVQGARGGAGT